MHISKKYPKLFSAITIAAFVLNLFMPGISAFAATGDKVFDIIEITDFHGTLEDTKGSPVAAVMAKNIKDIVNGNSGRTLIVSCGDNYQGSVLSNMLRGVPVMSAFNNIGVEVSGLGNHDFDWGLDTVTKPGIANYPIICANLLDKGTNERVFEPYKIFEKDGVKIAVVGAVTEELMNIVLADYVKDYKVGSIVDNVEQAAKEARAKGAQIVIALIHAGDNRNLKTAPVFDVANQLGGAGGVVDAVLGGGTHDLVNTTAANGTTMAIAGSYGKGFINMKITRHTDGTLAFDTSYIDGDTAGTVFPYGYKALAPVIDQAINNIVNDAKTEVGPVASQKLGEADTDLTIFMADSPWGESLAGNWVCDVLKAKVDADFAFINKGAMRIDIPRGDITMGTMYTFMPFDNTIMTADLTGAQIKTLLEQAVDDGGKGIQAAGLIFVYDPGAPSGGRIVSISKSDGTPVNMTDTSKTYKVATNDFMSTGGDGFDVYKTVTSINTNIPVRETLAQNIQQSGHITAQVQGRIKKIESAGLAAGTGFGLSLNNRDVVFDVPPHMENGQFFVPLRPLLEAMGSNVAWDGDTKTASACMPGVTLVVADGAKLARVNGSDLPLAAAAEIKNGRLIVPLQIILEATGAQSTWDGATQTLSLTLNEIAGFPTTVLDMQRSVQQELERIDQDLAVAAGELARTGLDGEEARRILNELAAKYPYVIDACTVDNNGTIIAVEPAAYHDFEGYDISQQEQVRRLQETRLPVLSLAFTSVEGVVAVDLEQPVFYQQKELIGSVSLLVKPEPLFAKFAASNLQQPETMIMQQDGYILYDTKNSQIGFNSFTDDLYQDYPELLSLARKVATDKAGLGNYTFLDESLQKQAAKRSAWTTVGLHGTEWRLIVNYIADDNSQV